jgi:hypothetical protein
MRKFFLKLLDWLFAPPEIDVEDVECPLSIEDGKPTYKW